MKVMVIGGAGYIGSHVCKELDNLGYEVIVVDDFSTGHRKAVIQYKSFYCDICNYILLKEIFDEVRPDAVIHMAAKIIVSQSVKQPIHYYQNNVGGMMNVLQCCKVFDVKHFVFSSTAAVYPPAHWSLNEDDVDSPINPYGKSKRMCEIIAEDLFTAWSDFNFTSLRYFNVAGADKDGQIGQSFPTSTHLIKIAVEAAIGKREYVEIYGNDYNTNDGTCIRDYVHVSDLARAHIAALNEQLVSKSQIKRVYNVGTGCGYSVKQVLNKVKEVTGVDFPVKISPRRAGDPAVLVADSSKIQRELHWVPIESTLDKMVASAYAWEHNKRY